MNNTSNITNPSKLAIGIFSNSSMAKQAIQELKNIGFAENKIFLLTQDNNIRSAPKDDISVTQKIIGNKSNEGTKTGAIAGILVGTFTGILVGLGAIAIPGVGPILLASAEGTALVTTLAGSAIGTATGAVLGGLIGLGIPKKQAKIYEKHFKTESDSALVVVQGNRENIKRAESLMLSLGIQEWNVYNLPPTQNDLAQSEPIAVVLNLQEIL
ncbi:hypothetical protein [Gloeothece verrucosa]|uniref:Signal transduction histidine kinase (STHK), LytS n=1 Tax=Gloeothece verrucosa (strain PCC 7822) TaxID=497965 RepID=E0ULU6_GLOV7|nr:hypothetical protein [Gloeothece verrucosa]ADN17926.1 signal transduction histidine kinase (STHK), LytS [Gloeothece verrucosa PCC 7822]